MNEAKEGNMSSLETKDRLIQDLRNELLELRTSIDRKASECQEEADCAADVRIQKALEEARYETERILEVQREKLLNEGKSEKEVLQHAVEEAQAEAERWKGRLQESDELRTKEGLNLAKESKRVEALKAELLQVNEDLAKSKRNITGDDLRNRLESLKEVVSHTLREKAELEEDAEGLKTKIDQAASASTKLKSQVKDLQYELSVLEKLTKEMGNARKESHAAYVKDKDDLSQGLNAIRAGIHVLRDYYAADKEEESFLQTESETQTEDMESDSESESDADADQQPAPPEKFKKSKGAGGGIIELLEVVESNLAKNLAELQTEEDDAQTAYEKEMQESKVSKATKDQDISYKTKEYTSLDKSVAELQSDAATTNEELAAVNEYFAKVKDRCVAKPDKYADVKAKREEEIKGLEEAKSLLESEGSFLQRRK